MKLVAILITLAALAGCSSASDRVTKLEFGDAKVLATTGNLRLVTNRARIQPNGVALNTICTEPSPDYAIAFGSTASSTGSVTLANGNKGDFNASAGTSELATALAGRSAGVLALRDGLYAACQSYANGVIGHDAYAIILSQYGDLLVALAGNSTDQAATVQTATTTTTAAAKAEDASSANKNAAGGATAPSAANATPSKDKATVATTKITSKTVDPMKKSTLAALLVACISENDPTRFRTGVGVPPIEKNGLLDSAFCKKVVAGALKMSTSS